MAVLKDFRCIKCNTFEEQLVSDNSEARCSSCGGEMERVFTTAPKQFHVIVPTHPGAKANKAGYIHSHGDKPATKIQSGYGGAQGPK